MSWGQATAIRSSRLVAAFVLVLAIAIGLPAAAMPSDPGEVRAEAAAKKKKKCKKGYKKVRVHGKVKCKKKQGATPQPSPSPSPPPPATADPRTRFLAMFNNSGWDRPITTKTTPPQFGEDLYNFCANGTFVNRYTAPLSGTDYISKGTWELVGDVKTGTVAGYNVVEGHVVGPGTDQYGETKQFDLYVDLSEQVPNIAYINQNEFTRVTPQAC